MSDPAQNLLQAALDDHRRGDLSSALAKYDQLVAAQPDHWDALYYRGTALLQLGNVRAAIETFVRAAALRPNVADVCNNLGVAYQALGDWEQAARFYHAAIDKGADGGLASFNLGRLMEQCGRLADAETHLRRAVQLKSHDGTYHLCLAALLGRRGKWEEAEQVLRQALEIDPANLDLAVNRAYALLQIERLDEAVDLYRSVLMRRPDYHEVHSNLAFVLERQGRLDEALAAAQRAVELRPDFAEGFNNLGTVLRSMHRLDAACRAFQTAVALKPDFALAEFNLGTTLLLSGNYREGWIGYRRHGHLGGRSAPGPLREEWDGRPIPGKRLLVYADQGFGDAIQFARFLPEAKLRSHAQIILQCPATLVRLFAELPGADDVIAENAGERTFDYHFRLASLPGLFEVTTSTAAQGIPYLRPPIGLQPEILNLLQTDAARRLRIGLVWQGNPHQARDVLRSCSLQRLLPLLAMPGAAFYSLQTGDVGRRQIADQHVDERLIDLGGMVTDFAETAAILAKLDLLITVDTAVAHLAGALGRPVWTMLCHTPDWRWHLDGADSPWYPTMRLFRQPRWGDWDAVVAQVHAALGPWIEKNIPSA